VAQWHSDKWRVLSNLSTRVASYAGYHPPSLAAFGMEGNNPRTEAARVDKYYILGSMHS
jgi:hypothetical protein